MILHHIQTSTTSDNALSLCLRYIAADDSILLAADAVNALLKPQLLTAMQNNDVYVLSDDIQARGLSAKIAKLQYPNIHPIDYTEFVNQTLRHSKVITW